MCLLLHPWWQISLSLSIQISIIHGWIKGWTEFSRCKRKRVIWPEDYWGALISTLSWDTSEIESPKTISFYSLELWPLHLWTGTRIDVCYQIVQNTRLSTMRTCDSAFLELSVRAREMLLSSKAWSCDPCLGPGATLPPLINQCTCKYICSILCTHNKLNKFVKFLQK